MWEESLSPNNRELKRWVYMELIPEDKYLKLVSVDFEVKPSLASTEKVLEIKKFDN